jgi:hypothetical protein
MIALSHIVNGRRFASTAGTALLWLLFVVNCWNCGGNSETTSGTATAGGGGTAGANVGSGGGGRGGTAGTLGPNGTCPSSVIPMKRCFRPDQVPGLPKVDSGVAEASVDASAAELDAARDATSDSIERFDAAVPPADGGLQCPPPNSSIGFGGTPTTGPFEEGNMCCYIVMQICG